MVEPTANTTDTAPATHGNHSHARRTPASSGIVARAANPSADSHR